MIPTKFRNKRMTHSLVEVVYRFFSKYHVRGSLQHKTKNDVRIEDSREHQSKQLTILRKNLRRRSMPPNCFRPLLRASGATIRLQAPAFSLSRTAFRPIPRPQQRCSYSTVKPSIGFGQPLHETHPHLIGPGECMYFLVMVLVMLN